MTIDAPGPTEAVRSAAPRPATQAAARPSAPDTEPATGARGARGWLAFAGRAAPVLGWILTLVIALDLGQGAYGQLTESERSVGMFEAIGYPASAVLLVGVLQGAAVLLYAVPWTGFLGGLLLTAYLGGAVAAHIRLEDSVSHTLTPVLYAVGVWAALFLRSERIRWAVLTGR
ncbi:DoxX family protein [Promicromonospora sp. NPDC023805]|uniref:DoxX family protein n=1 Tax=Promicromonospora sp. NPDC023805 TaxID=3154696 RepID=UPI0033E84544